ncbi:hypothetical protein BGX20_008600 [Mortierella sp. AD010]|nr:hypothetical protein BGX20_008600 [Mortierella sp. AD010]
MFRNLFSSPTSRLPLEDVLELANKYLENARKENDPVKALRFCNDANSVIKDAEKIYAKNGVKDPVLRDDTLGYRDMAQKSYNKADKLGYVHAVVSKQTGSFQLGSIQSLCPPTALSAVPAVATAMYQDISKPDIAEPTDKSPVQTVVLTEIEPCAPQASRDVAGTPGAIFVQSIVPPSVKYTLPGVTERIGSTPQLAYCLSLLPPSLTSRDGLNELEIGWSQAKIDDPDERERLRTVAVDVIRAFVRDELKRPDVIAEVVCLAAVLNEDDFRKLLQAFINGIERSALLELHLLDGLAQLMRNAPPGYTRTDDLVKILEILAIRLKGTHQQSTGHMYRLAVTVSQALDSMVDSQVKGLKREQLHEPLSEYLKELQMSSDPSLVYQAAYAYQALQYIPDDETILQTVVRRTGKVVTGIYGIVSAARALDLNGFIGGLQDIQVGVESAASAIKPVSNSLTEGGQGFLESLKGSLSFSRRSAWYPALRGLDTLLQEGRVCEFEKLIREAPCKKDAAFQWGVCQRLGELAINTLWDDGTRQRAVSFLGTIYRDDATWNPKDNIRQWILYILTWLTDASDTMIGGHTQGLLLELKADGNTLKQTLFQIPSNKTPSSNLLMVALPPKTSPLLDCVQNKPDVEVALRHLKSERLRGRGGDVYISPRAKASVNATEEFDLTSKVQEFLHSDKKVFLLQGDSGAGKSTFIRELEIGLWNKYKPDGPIPLFVFLPTIERPEQDLIGKQLQKASFTEGQIREMKMHREFILICDGYDESQQTRNLYTSNELNQPGGCRVQMVISCRTEYNGFDYKDRFQPIDRNNYRISGQFQEAVITPFNEDQIQEYIDQYVSLGKPPWGSKDYHKAFSQIPNLQGLVKNPFLLKLAMEVLPQIFEKRTSTSVTRITSVELYDEFVAQWLERSKIRFGEMDLSIHDKEAFKRLSDSGFKMNGIRYLKELSTAIYDNQGGNPAVSYSEHRDKKTWKETWFNSTDGKNLLMEAIPLVRNGDQYRFIHKSVLEYGVTLSIFDPNAHEGLVEPSSPSPLPRRGSTSSVLSFEVPSSSPLEETASNTEPQLVDSPLGRKSFVDEPSILQFLVDRVQQQPVFKNQLHTVIQQSKIDKSVRIAVSNAITVLVKAGVSFAGADLRGINIPGADLSHGMFDSARLDGADLRKTNLRSAWLRKARLNGAHMTKARFGELPFIKEFCEVIVGAYTPDGNAFAMALANGNICLYDTTDGWCKLAMFAGHDNVALSLAFSPTDDRIASASWDGMVKLWSVQTFSCLDLSEHSKGVYSVAYSPKGDQIASGSADNTVRLWDVKTGNCTCTLKGHSDQVFCVAYSPAGDQVASGSFDNTVRLWNPETGDCAFTLQHNDEVYVIAYSPKGGRLVSGGNDMIVRLWDVETGDCIHVMKGHIDKIMCIAYSPKGDQIASGCIGGYDLAVRLWDVETGNCVRVLKGHSGGIRSIVYSPNGDQIASGGHDMTVRLWDVETYDCVDVFQGHGDQINTIVYSPSGDQIASVSYDRTVRFRNMADVSRSYTPQGHSSVVYTIAYSPKGNRVVSGSLDCTARLWDVETGQCIRTLEGHGEVVMSIAFSPDGDRFASGSLDSTMRMWDAESGNCLCIVKSSWMPSWIQGEIHGVNSVDYSPKGDQVASGCGDGTVRLWNVETSSCIHVLRGHCNVLCKVVYSPKGDLIASGSLDSTVRLWDVETGDCISILEGHDSDVIAISYSPKGDRIASGSDDMTVRQWDIKTSSCVHVLRGHRGGIINIVYSPEGDQIASSSEDGTVRLWDVETGNCIHALLGHRKRVTMALEYSPKGDMIASGSGDSTVRLWSIETGECLLTISDFHGSVSCLAWDMASNGQYLVTGSQDNSVRRWQIAKEQDEYKAILHWSSSNDALVATDTTFDDAQGLSTVNEMLLQQRGALFSSARTLQGKAEKELGIWTGVLD